MPNRTSQILIASSSFDRPTWEPVAHGLAEKGYDVIAFEADKVALGGISFTVQIGGAGEFCVSYAGQSLDTDNIGAAWYRRTSFIADNTEDSVRQLGIDGERKAILGAVWEQLPEGTWLNAPDRIQKASRKISQLRLAQRVGFHIPTTTVTNDWPVLLESLPPDIIYKSSHPLLFGTNEVQSLFTTPFTNKESSLPIDKNPFPGIWQANIDKAREWRITVVGEDSFDAAIYTDHNAKDDWRKHQDKPTCVSFRQEHFPDRLHEKCIDYLTQSGLGFGAFDFIEDNDGKITFLECNPNGQFRWLEDELGLPISAAIVSRLIRITSDR